MGLKKCIVFYNKNIFGDTPIKVYLSMFKTVKCANHASPITTFEKPYKVLAPWNEIEFHQLKPSQLSPEDHLLLVIYDPASAWVSAAAVLKPCSCDVAEFLFENFCNYGVALCTVYGFNSFEFMELKEE